jgi:hypothetical protein
VSSGDCNASACIKVYVEQLTAELERCIPKQLL